MKQEDEVVQFIALELRLPVHYTEVIRGFVAFNEGFNKVLGFCGI